MKRKQPELNRKLKSKVYRLRMAAAGVLNDVDEIREVADNLRKSLDDLEKQARSLLRRGRH